MSLGIYPVFNPKVPAAQFRALGEVLVQNFHELERIAGVYGLPGFTAFADSRDVPPDFDGSPDDLKALLGPCNEWFEAGAGRAAFLALADAIAGEPDIAAELDDPDEVVAELEELARVLGEAERRGAEFRLEMG